MMTHARTMDILFLLGGFPSEGGGGRGCGEARGWRIGGRNNMRSLLSNFWEQAGPVSAYG